MYAQRSRRVKNPAAYAAAVQRNAYSASPSLLRSMVKKALVPVRRARAPARKSYRPRAAYKGGEPNLGNQIGSFLGGLAYGPVKNLIKQLTGFGDYQVRANSLMPGKNDQIPTFGTGEGMVRIQHREYIRDVYSSTTFQNAALTINPGLSETFPWLSAIAQNFEQYQILGMVFEFKSNSANALNSTNTALGTCILSTEYNALSPPFINKQQMENNQFTVSTKPSVSCMHPVECDPKQTPIPQLFIRTGDVSTGDLRMYDMGNFQFATVGMQAADVNLGELHVSYDIVLFKPKLSSGLNLAGKTAQYSIGGPFSDVVPLGTTVVELFDAIGLDIDTTTATITFPEGTNGIFRLTLQVIGDPMTNVAAALGTITTSNCTRLTVFQNYTSDAILNNLGGGQSGFILSFFFEIEDPSLVASIQFVPVTGWIYPLSGIGGSPGSLGDLIISQVNGNLPTSPPPGVALPAPGLTQSTKSKKATPVKKYIESAAAGVDEQCEDEEKEDAEGDEIDEVIATIKKLKTQYSFTDEQVKNFLDMRPSKSSKKN